MPHAAKKLTECKRTDYRRSATERGYDSTWAKVADLRRMLNPICQHCEARGITKEYDIGEDGKTLKLIVDHVIPVHVRPDLRLVLENTQTLCRACHKVKTDNDVLIYGAAE